jgi:hypothetical protein
MFGVDGIGSNFTIKTRFPHFRVNFDLCFQLKLKVSCSTERFVLRNVNASCHKIDLNLSSFAHHTKLIIVLLSKTFKGRTNACLTGRNFVF